MKPKDDSRAHSLCLLRKKYPALINGNEVPFAKSENP